MQPDRGHRPLRLALAALAVLAATASPARAQFLSHLFGSPGSLPGQLQFPEGVAADADGNVYVADTANHRVQKFDAGGQPVLVFGSFGSGNGQLSGPSSVAVAADGSIYVADRGNGRVQKFDASGNFVLKLGGVFNQPGDVALDAAGNVYVASLFALQKFDAAGNHLLSFPVGGIVPRGLAVDGDGNVVYYEKDNGTVDKRDPAGALIARFGRPNCVVATGDGCTDPDGPGPLELGDGQFGTAGAEGVAADRLGNIYVADSRNFRIQKFTPAGQFLAKWGGPGTAPGELGTLDGPMAIAVDASDAIYVLDSDNGRVQVFVTPPQVSIGSATGAGPIGLATDAGGFSRVAAVAESSLPTSGKPSGVTFPFGFLSFTITNLAPGQTVTLTLTYPAAVASPARYWKVIGGVWTDVTSQIGDDDGDSVLTLTLSDGGTGDADGAVNGQISDPGGVAVGTAGGSSSTPCTVSGAGLIPGGRAFALQVRYAAGMAAPQGAVLFLDHPEPGLFRSLAITRLVCAGGQAAIEGEGRVSGTLVPFQVSATDAGPHDAFAIHWPEYAASGPVLGSVRVQ